MPFELEISCPKDLVITTVIINDTINIDLIAFYYRNDLTFYYGYSSGILPATVNIKFLPIFNGCQFRVWFSMADDINYHHTNAQRLLHSENTLLPNDNDFNFYSCKNCLLPIGNTASVDFNLKYITIGSFTSILEYKIAKVKLV